MLPDGLIGRVRGARDNAYTAGVICAKVARYADRLYHPDRLTKPLKRIGAKGEGRFAEISWDEALETVAQAFLSAEARYGAQSVWPYHYAGTMGLVQRDSIHRLRHAKGYSLQFDTICTNMAWTGFVAGTGKLAGVDPREMAVSDLVVIWGTNPVSTQVNVMTHAVTARKTRGAKIVCIDVYPTQTVKQADLGLVLKPGTDAALACAVMHVLFRDNHADWDYLRRYTDCPDDLAAHVAGRDPAWASAITGLSVEEIETFARMVGETPRTFFRLGYGFTRSRNGSVSMHAASCIPAVTGAWQHEGGGAFHNNGAIYTLDKSMIEASALRDPSVRQLDQSQIGRVLTGDPTALRGGPPVAAMLIQNTNPVSVAPEQTLVKQGFARDDLFVCVHEQFMTETAEMADIVLPATQFMEHDDIYKGGGHQYLVLGPKLVEGPGETRENLWVLNEIAQRVGASEHPGFSMSAREHIDWMLNASNFGSLEHIEAERWIDCQPDFNEAHYLNGFAWPDGKFRFRPQWPQVPAPNDGPMGPWTQLPSLPDYWAVVEASDDTHPFRLVTAPARSFLNSTFNETTASRQKEKLPELMIGADDATSIGVANGDQVRIGNARGAVLLHARFTGGLKPGVVIAEGIWPNEAYPDGCGINTLIGADAVAPYGGAAFHDTAIWVRKA